MTDRNPDITPQKRHEFWDQVQYDPETGCWVWRGSADKYGRGKFRTRPSGTVHTAPRVAYRLCCGKWPNKYVLHHCDNPACVNPDHLYLGTQFENMRDMKQRTFRSTQKLTQSKADAIRQASGTGRYIAAKFGVSSATVSMIRNGKIW